MRRKRVQELNHYEILNLPVTASEKDVEEAYLQLTYVYGDNSRATYGALSEEEKYWMVKRIQSAYETLVRKNARMEYDQAHLGLDEEQKRKIARDKTSVSHGQRGAARAILVQMRSSAQQGAAGKKKEDANPFMNSARVTGSHLKNIRVAKGASLDEISEITKVKKSYLEAIEKEDAKKFPAPIFMKGFLKAYAKALGLDPVEISEKYLSK